VKVIWSPLSIDRAEEEAAFIAEDKPEAADLWLRAVLKAVDRLELFPNSGHPVPEIRVSHYRQVIYKSHRIIYRIDADRVLILTVRLSKQRLDLSELPA